MKSPLLPVLWLFALPLAAQQEPALTETVEVRLIEVDAVVTDREGNPVVGLGPEDFELFENGRRQVITNFSEYRESEDLPAAVPTPSAPAGVQVTVAPPQPRTIILLIDALPLRGSPRGEVFEKLRVLIDRVIRENDRAQVLLWHDRHGVRHATPLTADRAIIEEALTTLEKNLHATEAGVSVDEQAQIIREAAAARLGEGATPASVEAAAAGEIATIMRQSAEQDLAVMRRKTAAIQRIVASLAQPRGKSVFVYVSDMFPLVAGKRHFIGSRPAPEAFAAGGGYSTREMLEAIIDTANAHGVVFYGVRPSVPSTVGQFQSRLEETATYNNVSGGSEAAADAINLQNELDGLHTVAVETGGVVTVGASGLTEAVERISRDLSSYYTLAYRTKSDGEDRERRIEVRPKNRDLVVRSRTSIIDRSERTRARDLLVARLFERGPSGDIDFDVALGAPKPARFSRSLIPVRLSIPADQLRFDEEGSELAANFAILAVAGANIGQVTKLTEDSRRVAVPKGSSQDGAITYDFEILSDGKPSTVSIAVFDEKSGLVGTQSIVIDGSKARVETVSNDTAADAMWNEALGRADRERKPLLVWFRPNRCTGCPKFERDAIPHPAIQRRLQSMVFVTLPATAGDASKAWSAKETGFALFDRRGLLRVRWVGVPDTTTFGAILDAVLAVGPQFERAVQVAEAAGIEEGEIEAAVGLALLGRNDDAREALRIASASPSLVTRQRAAITGALLDARQDKRRQAFATLDSIVAEAADPEIAAEAWFAIGNLHRGGGDAERAIAAFTNAISISRPDAAVRAAAVQALSATTAATQAAVGILQIVEPDRQIVSGRQTIRTMISSAAVARVAFDVDGQSIREVTRPPFSASLDFGELPERRTVRAIAYDDAGTEIGRDELVVNDAGETFWLRLVEPREGAAAGSVAVSLNLRAPVARAVRRVVLSWNDEERAILTSAPWRGSVDIPAGQTGVLRAVAELDDGRTTEDAVLLNASGAVEHASVQLVEIPITIRARGDVPALSEADVIIREGSTRRAVESITSGAEAPLTIGILIDSSASMQKTLPDVQESALRFLETVMNETDRAFVVAFNSKAHLIQPATADKEALRRRIMGIQPQGLTALHDAIVLGLLQFEGVKGRRALVVFSDGVDRTSRYKPEDVEELARRINVPLHVIAAQPVTPQLSVTPYQPRFRGMQRPESISTGGAAWNIWRAGYEQLASVANATGGSSHSIRDLKELRAVFVRIESALQWQLLATVRTDPGVRENEWRRIEVEIAGRNLDVHAPEGYYAPW